MSNQRIISNSPNANGSVSQRSLGNIIYSPNQQQQKNVNNMPVPSGVNNSKYQNQLYKNMNDIIKQSNNKEDRQGRNSHMRKNLNTEVLNNDLSQMAA